MITVGELCELFRLASKHLSHVEVPKVDIGPNKVFYCDINSLSRAIVDLTEKAFSEYMKKTRLMRYPDRYAREVFRSVAERKIMRKIRPALAQILFPN